MFDTVFKDTKPFDLAEKVYEGGIGSLFVRYLYIDVRGNISDNVFR